MNRDTSLDHAARILHAQAVASVPVALRVQLHPRERPAHGRTWGTVLAMAAVGGLALAAAWQLRMPDRAPAAVATGMQDSGTRAVAVAGTDNASVSPTAAFDNDPEFYAWLGSAPSVAMVEH